jgi:hypothetical protein
MSEGDPTVTRSTPTGKSGTASTLKEEPIVADPVGQDTKTSSLIVPFGPQDLLRILEQDPATADWGECRESHGAISSSSIKVVGLEALLGRRSS